MKLRNSNDTELTNERRLSDQRAVAIWLFFCCGAVYVMIVIGGVTRLTESGLSMIEWRPLIGIFPPLSVDEWERVFGLYRETPEFRLENSHISLAEFKSIFWWEYIHRVWGRFIGVLFVIGFLWLFLQKRIKRWQLPHLFILLVLGALQGIIGWWMVSSGFADRTDVSQYRLVIHLGMAFVILGYLLSLALTLIEKPKRMSASLKLRQLSLVTLCIVSVTIISGGLTAGVDAGLIYNTWPLMEDGIVPESMFAETPLWLNFFENPATIQFDHRILAYLTSVFVITLCLRMRREAKQSNWIVVSNLLVAVLAIQVALGVSTLLFVVPLPLAIAHQSCAVALFTATVWATHVVR